MEFFQHFDPLTWLVLASALIISIMVLFAKAIKFVLKLVVIGVMLLFVIYFLRQAGLF